MATAGDEEKGRVLLPEREERKALEWSPLKESREWIGQEGEEHTSQREQHVQRHGGWKEHSMVGGRDHTMGLTAGGRAGVGTEVEMGW